MDDSLKIPEVANWHLANGGFALKFNGHALRLLNEVVELCVASGASAEEISGVVADEIHKATRKEEFDTSGINNFDAMREEVADVGACLAVFCFHSQISPGDEIMKRKWKVDENGVLWRDKL